MMIKLSISTSDTSSLNNFMTYVHSYPCLTAPHHHCTNDECKSKPNEEVIDYCEGAEVMHCKVCADAKLDSKWDDGRRVQCTLVVKIEQCMRTVVSSLPFLCFYRSLWCERVWCWGEVASRFPLHRPSLLCSVMTNSHALTSDTSSEQKSNRILKEEGCRTCFSLLFYNSLPLTCMHSYPCLRAALAVCCEETRSEERGKA